MGEYTQLDVLFCMHQIFMQDVHKYSYMLQYINGYMTDHEHKRIHTVTLR